VVRFNKDFIVVAKESRIVIIVIIIDKCSIFFLIVTEAHRDCGPVGTSRKLRRRWLILY